MDEVTYVKTKTGAFVLRHLFEDVVSRRGKCQREVLIWVQGGGERESDGGWGEGDGLPAPGGVGLRGGGRG